MIEIFRELLPETFQGAIPPGQIKKWKGQFGLRDVNKILLWDKNCIRKGLDWALELEFGLGLVNILIIIVKSFQETLYVLNGMVVANLKVIHIPCRCIFVFDPHNQTFQYQLNIFRTVF